MLVGARMKPRNVLIASAIAVAMLAAGCSSGSGAGAAKLKLDKTKASFLQPNVLALLVKANTP
jgi:ABC-type phosphate/phosphonate transport system substrate-binding protein